MAMEVSRNIMKEIDLFKRIASDYVGTITEENESTYITNKNEICNYYQDGKVATKKVVPCKVGIRLIHLYDGNTRWLLEFEEQTFSILGGGSRDFTEQSLIQVLERYNFKMKQKELSIFDFI